jgi:hypothetical protein
VQKGMLESVRKLVYIAAFIGPLSIGPQIAEIWFVDKNAIARVGCFAMPFIDAPAGDFERSSHSAPSVAIES